MSGLALIIFPLIIVNNLSKKPSWIKPLSLLTAALSWFILLPAGKLYLVFYPATKTLIKAGSKPWAHSIIMETKEHWGLLLPIIATVAAGLIYTKKAKESRRWWLLLSVLSLLIGIMGRLVSTGGISS